MRYFSDALFYDVMDPERIRALIPNLRGTVAGRKDHLGVEIKLEKSEKLVPLQRPRIPVAQRESRIPVAQRELEVKLTHYRCH